MGIRAWWMSIGIVGAIAKDIIKKYLMVTSKFPEETEKEKFQRTLEYWLTLNEQKIRRENNEEKISRLDVVIEQYFVSNLKDLLWENITLLHIYFAIVHIETGVDEYENEGLTKDLISVFKKSAVKTKVDLSSQLPVED